MPSRDRLAMVGTRYSADCWANSNACTTFCTGSSLPGSSSRILIPACWISGRCATIRKYICAGNMERSRSNSGTRSKRGSLAGSPLNCFDFEGAAQWFQLIDSLAACGSYDFHMEVHGKKRHSLCHRCLCSLGPLSTLLETTGVRIGPPVDRSPDHLVIPSSDHRDPRNPPMDGFPPG